MQNNAPTPLRQPDDEISLLDIIWGGGGRKFDVAGYLESFSTKF